MKVLFLFLLLSCLGYCVENGLHLDLQRILSPRIIFWTIGTLLIIASPFIINHLKEKSKDKS